MAWLKSFHTGHCTHPSCMVLKGSGFASRCFPSQAFLIETRAGWAIWDTGYAEHFLDATREGIYRLYPVITPVQFEARQALAAQLRGLGVHPSEVTAVVLSHLHADHMAGLRDFPSAKIFCSEQAWSSVRGTTGISALRQAFLPALVPSDIEDRLVFVESCATRPLPLSLQPFAQGYDVLGTGDMLVVPLPGHAPGHIGAFVETASAWVLLAADASWTTEGYADLRGPSELTFLFQHNRRAYYQTLQALNALHSRGSAHIALAHVFP